MVSRLSETSFALVTQRRTIFRQEKLKKEVEENVPDVPPVVAVVDKVGHDAAAHRLDPVAPHAHLPDLGLPHGVRVQHGANLEHLQELLLAEGDEKGDSRRGDPWQSEIGKRCLKRKRKRAYVFRGNPPNWGIFLQSCRRFNRVSWKVRNRT